MSDFVPQSIELQGSFTLSGRTEPVFQLFSPLGEIRWVPGWSPELLHPPGASWEVGLVFRTREELGDAIWIVTKLDHETHSVEYHRVENGRYVARVAVRCIARGECQTEVHAAYTFIGLSERGNGDIALMTPAAYEEKMARWQRWIQDCLSKGTPR